MTKMLTVPSHVEVDVRRPSGEIETVRVPNSKTWSPGNFSACKEATRKAGRGEALAYRNVTMQIEEPAEFARLNADEKAWDESRNAIYRAMDAQPDTDSDNTPATKDDR